MSTLLPVTVWLLVGLSFGLAVQLPLRITTAAWPVHVPKAAAQALSGYLVVAGLVGGTLAAALFVRQPSAGMAVAAALGVTAALLSSWYLQQIRAPNDALTAAFGAGWQEQLPTQARAGMLEGRRRWALPGGVPPRFERDLVYAKVPETDVELRADVWQPPAGVEPSGLGLIYVHGGSYALGAKDFGTRPAFRHLARQGHVITDINYRLVDDTDIFGMVGDVKRAIIWLKDHTATYGVNPERIVVAGASAGGNLALLAAYTPGHPLTTPDEVVADTSVRAAVSFYGVHDWPAFARLSSGDELAVRLLGGELEDMPQRYAAASPVTHVGPGTPATLLIQGLHDQAHLIDANRKLAAWLAHNGARVATVELAATDHGFDIMPPGLGGISPPAIAALYDLERFLAVLATTPVDGADTGAQRLPPRPGAHRPGHRPQERFGSRQDRPGPPGRLGALARRVRHHASGAQAPGPALPTDPAETGDGWRERRRPNHATPASHSMDVPMGSRSSTPMYGLSTTVPTAPATPVTTIAAAQEHTGEQAAPTPDRRGTRVRP